MGAEHETEMQKLTPEAREVLKRIAAEYAALPFAADKAEQLRPEFLCRAEQMLALGELLRAGLLELHQKVWGEKLYQIPQRQLPLISRILWPVGPRQPVERDVHVKSAACTGLAGELFRGLLFTAREGLPLTAKGVVHKKQISRLAGQLSMQEEQLAALLQRPADLEPYPLPVIVILDLMAVLGLTSRQSTGYELDREKLRLWLGLSEQEMTSTLYRIVINRYGRLDPAGQHFRHLISGAEFRPGEWYAVAPLIEWMISSGLAKEEPEGGTDESGLTMSALAWLRCLAGFGWCELGYSKDGEACFRWKAMKPQLDIEETGSMESSVTVPEETGLSSGGEGKFIIQPDFEVLVPPEVPYHIRWTLAGYAELLHNDDLWSFRLTREMLEFAAEQGCSPEEGIAWLAVHAQTGLPEQVELALRQWARGIGRTVLSEVILLSCAGDAEGEDIAGHPRLQDMLTRIGPHHFIVHPGCVEQLRKELAASGMAPPGLLGGREAPKKHKIFDAFESTRTPVPFAFPSPAPERGLLGSAVHLQRLPLDNALLEQEVLPGEDAVPQMWLHSWRQYHVTTAQKVMEQALFWGIKVRISLHNQIADFIPEQINGRPWGVRGILLRSGADTVEEIRLTAEDWQEMKLLHPVKQRNSSSSGAAGYVMIR